MTQSSSETSEKGSQYQGPPGGHDEVEREISPGAKERAEAKPTFMRRIIGLFGGVLGALLIYTIMPGDMEVWPRLTAATAVLMAVWWMTEAIPIPATALLPLVIFPLLVPEGDLGSGDEASGGISVDDVGASYGNNIIFLFMGGFMLALAMQRWNLHRRIALGVLRLMGSKPANLIGGFMIATGFISMWVSNTATAVMMLPIGISVLMLVNRVVKEQGSGVEGIEGDAVEAEEDGTDTNTKQVPVKSNFGTALMLGIAYAASVGSVSTIIGTPPNALLVGHMSENHDVTIGFGQWMLVGAPVAIIMLFATWFLLTKVIFKPEITKVPGGAELIRKEFAKLGPMSAAELRVLIIFFLAAVSWISIPLISDYWLDLEEPFISDAGIAMTVGILLFLLPAGTERGVRLLNWNSAVDLPWGVLLLFGGGLALSGQFSSSGLSEWLGTQMEGLGGVPIWVLVLVATVGIMILTEMTSNTATAATFLPVASGVAMGTGVDPLMIAAPVALAATCAFMLPVGTPPNAIAYGSGYVTIGQMVKGGLWLNLIGIVVITVVSMTILVWVFGISL